MSERKISAPWIAGTVLLLLLWAYFGAYYAMVTPQEAWPGGFLTEENVKGTPVIASYPFGGSVVHGFFGPANRVDRIIRPRTWEADVKRMQERFLKGFGSP